MMHCAERRALKLALVLAAGLAVPGPVWTPAGGPAVSGVAAAQEKGPVTLRLGATEGETSIYRFHSRTRISPPPGMGMETTADATLLVRSAVEDVVGDTLRMSARIDSFALDLSSESDQVRSDLRQTAEESRKNVVGETFRFAVTRRGEILESGSPVGAAAGARRLDRTVRQLAFATLPSDPVSVGESWSGSRMVDASTFGIPVEGEVVTRSRSTLNRIFRREGSRVAEIGVEATFAFEPDSAASGPFDVDMEGSSARTLHFDVDEGRFLSSSGAQDFTVHMSLPGQGPGGFTLQGSSETSARLVDD